MSLQEILKKLVSFPSVVGQPNGEIIAWVSDFLKRHDIAHHVLWGPEGDRANLFATIGPADVPGVIFSGHLDVVPAGVDGWLGDPFELRQNGDRLIARGAVDMKGFVAVALAASVKLRHQALTRPIQLALSYDEEAGCRGVPHLLASLPDLCAPPMGAIIGEPTGLRPILRHKGKAALRITAQGLSGHSSRPDLGRNAIEALLPVLNAAVTLADTLRESGDRNPYFEPAYSTVQMGVVSGGVAINVIPEHAQVQIEARCVPGAAPLEVLAPLLKTVDKYDALSAEVISNYPALDQDTDSPFADMLVRVSEQTALPAVSFGTEAGLFHKAGIASIVCGPGDIARAHKPEEYITLPELEAAYQMLLRVPQDPWFQATQ